MDWDSLNALTKTTHPESGRILFRAGNGLFDFRLWDLFDISLSHPAKAPSFPNLLLSPSSNKFKTHSNLVFG